MMFLVGYISCPPTIGLFIPATAEITASPIRDTTTKMLRFITLAILRLNLRPRIRYAARRKSDCKANCQDGQSEKLLATNREKKIGTKKARSPKAARGR